MASSESYKPRIFFYRFIRGLLALLYRVCFRVKIYRTSSLPSHPKGVIVAANHASYLDPPLVGIALPMHVTFLAKDYLFKPFILGTALRWLGVLPIKSGDEDFRSIRQLLRLLKTGAYVLLFPEGTRSVDGQLQDPETGIGFLALKSGAAILPAYLEGTFDAFPRAAKMFRCRPISIYVGRSFVPSQDQSLTEDPEPYRAVSLKIMDEIRRLRAEAQVKN